MKLLVTSGATREPIDAVRFLSNVSTGATGAALADAFAAAGHAVTLLHGVGSAIASRVCRHETFTSADDLRMRLRQQLATGAFDAVIMTAAVADYRPAAALAGKISSSLDRLTLELVRNPKILPQLKTFSPRPLRVIGFKLTVGADEAARRAAVAAQFAAGGVDAIVHNDLAEIRERRREEHPFHVYRSLETPPQSATGATALAAALARLLENDFSAP